MRLFHLQRIEDISGVSGTGKVAEGVEFTDGTCAMRWLTNVCCTGFYDSLHDLLHIHGHNGATRIVFLDGDVVR